MYFFFNAPYASYLTDLFNIINAILIVSFINLIFKISVNGDESKITTNNFMIFTLIFLLILIGSHFLQNAIWKTVGLQYFWGIWLLTYIFTKNFYAKNSFFSNDIVLFLIGIVIGLYNEIYVAILLILIFGYYIYAFIYKQKITKISYFLFGNVLGGVILLVAPGNYIRLGV